MAGVMFQEEKHSNEEIYKTLNPLLGAWFKYKFNGFTEPQRYAILNIHRRENTLISSPTGTGKTLSAFAAILNELITLSEHNNLEDKVYCIYISPLRALANDIEKNLNEPLEEIKKAAKKLKKKIDVRVAVRTGDTSTADRAKMLRKPPHILICTPETLAIILNAPKFREHLREIQWGIIDEIHALAENKRGMHLSISLERLQRLTPEMTRIGLSATISPLDKMAEFLVGYENGKPRDCKVVDVRFLKKLDLKVLCPLPDMVNVTQSQIHDALYKQLHDLIQKHRTTLVFTNTRSATERVVHYLKDEFPKHYGKRNIEAHHSSLSRELRINTENRLKNGELKCVVSSTSLELGIDIGYIDLVILLGSPKSVARALQRCGRSGHKLHDEIKGRIIVLDRDDLVECSVLLKNAIEKKIDNIRIPENGLDVLAQQIFGIAIEEKQKLDDVFRLIRQSYCYRDLQRSDFLEVVKYLAGEYTRLEERYVYAKIWHDPATGIMGKRGKMARILYMTNVGTIPDEAKIKVKCGGMQIGTIDEIFMERLKKGDVFVLGGESYTFKYASGMVANVAPAFKRPPTVPSWFSEMLPLSFDLAMEIEKFRELMEGKFEAGRKKAEVLEFLNSYLYIDRNSANAIYEYFREQYLYSKIPSDKKILIELYKEGEMNHAIVHSLFGRRVNDALSRAVAYIVSRLVHKDVEINMNDNGFVVSCDKKMQIERIFGMLHSNELEMILEKAIEQTELLNRRFRHCATRALMILRSYHGRKRTVGRQQMSSRLLLSAVKRISNDFPILKETRREILRDMMDLEHATEIVKGIEEGRIKLEVVNVSVPSPFAFNLYAEGYADIMKIEGKLEFIKRMHEAVMERIGGRRDA